MSACHIIKTDTSSCHVSIYTTDTTDHYLRRNHLITASSLRLCVCVQAVQSSHKAQFDSTLGYTSSIFGKFMFKGVID
ncbi:unnamed protein product [Lactuca virosa]|uniref:Uncharacterized protein n=1 Tax=Lactuca virosa TaxID=75947 RepID=A0AAU9PPW2_9ASTR|nr:unnamed protein product [Lactuca virosa]